jgi:hypothetical protein
MFTKDRVPQDGTTCLLAVWGASGTLEGTANFPAKDQPKNKWTERQRFLAPTLHIPRAG